MANKLFTMPTHMIPQKPLCQTPESTRIMENHLSLYQLQ